MDMQDIMYTLGMIARAIWPGGDVPPAILDQMLIRPEAGLALATQHKAGQSADQEQLADLFKRLPAPPFRPDPEKGLKTEDQGPFWIGFYHFASGQEFAKKYGPDHLRVIGEALYGERWQSDIARDLNVDSRRVRQWLASERPIPAGIWVELAAKLRQRKQTIAGLLSSFEGSH